MTIWTDEMEETLKALWPSALSVGTIAERLGVTRKALDGKRDGLGLPPRYRRRYKSAPATKPARDWAALKARCRELDAQGMQRKAISDELNVARSTICNWLGVQEYGEADAQFDPTVMKYDLYQEAWVTAAGPIDTPLFKNIRCSDFGKPPAILTHIPRAVA